MGIFGGRFYSFVFDVDDWSMDWMLYKEMFKRSGFEIIQSFPFSDDRRARIRIRCRLIGKIGKFRSFECLGDIALTIEKISNRMVKIWWPEYL